MRHVQYYISTGRSNDYVWFPGRPHSGIARRNVISVVPNHRRFIGASLWADIEYADSNSYIKHDLLRSREQRKVYDPNPRGDRNCAGVRDPRSDDQFIDGPS